MNQATNVCDAKSQPADSFTATSVALTPIEVEQLDSLLRDGPLFAGDTIHSSLVRGLYDKGLVQYGVVRGQEGYAFANTRGLQVLRAFRSKFVR